MLMMVSGLAVPFFCRYAMMREWRSAKKDVVKADPLSPRQPGRFSCETRVSHGIEKRTTFCLCTTIEPSASLRSDPIPNGEEASFYKIIASPLKPPRACFRTDERHPGPAELHRESPATTYHCKRISVDQEYFAAVLRSCETMQNRDMVPLCGFWRPCREKARFRPGGQCVTGSSRSKSGNGVSESARSTRFGSPRKAPRVSGI